MSLLSCKNKPSMTIQDNRMVLSLPDAMTPVVWMIDLNDTGTFVMRVEQDDNGLYVLQKIEGSGQSATIEDVAYYTDQPQAVSAMEVVGRFSSIKGGACSVASFDGVKSLVWRLLKLTGLILVGLFVVMFVLTLILNAVGVNTSVPQQGALVQPQQGVQQQDSVTRNPDAIGVPMSADDFLKEKNSGLFPF